MLVRTGLRAALATEMVSFWICISAALLDFFSPSAVLVDTYCWCVAAVDAAAVVDDADEEDTEDAAAGTGAGSAVIRSISVVPEESFKKSKEFVIVAFFPD